METPTPPPPTPSITALLHLLSRADTLHDFEGERSVLSKSEVITELNEIDDLKEDKLFRPINEFKDIDEYNLRGILNKTTAALVNLSFPQSYTPRIINRITGVKAYEPRTVLFYEMHEHLLKPYYPKLNLGKYVSYEQLVGYKFGNDSNRGEYMVGDKQDYRAESAFNSATMAYMNLGTTEKLKKTGQNRLESGIYTKRRSVRYTEIKDILTSFFGNKEKIYLVVDTTGIKLQKDLGFGEEGNEIQLLCNVAGDWDGASKSDKCDSVINTISDNKDDALQRAVFELNDIKLSTDGRQSEAEIKRSTTTRKLPTAEATVEVKPLAQCVKQLIDGRNRKNCNNYGGLELRETELFDIKRTGDAYQALMTKKVQNGITSTTYVFVTLDHLAFLKARLNGVPCIFTSKDQKTEEKLMFLYKPGVDKNAIVLQYQAIQEELRALLGHMETLTLGRVIDSIAFFQENQPLRTMVRNANYTDKTLTMQTIYEYYHAQVATHTTTLDPIFTNVAVADWKYLPALDGMKEAVQDFVAKSEIVTSFNGPSTSLFKNVSKIPSWFPKTVYKIINSVLFIEIMARVSNMYKQFDLVQNDNRYLSSITEIRELLSSSHQIHPRTGENVQSSPKRPRFDLASNPNLERLIQHEQVKQLENNDLDISYYTRKIEEMNKEIKRFSYLKPTATQGATAIQGATATLLGLEVDDYDNIFKRITSIINTGLYGKKVGEAENVAQMIAKLSLSEGTRRQRISTAGKVSNILVFSIMNKVLGTLLSFACVKLNSIDVESTDTKKGAKNVVLNTMIRNFQTYINGMKTSGGSFEKPSQKGGAPENASPLAAFINYNTFHNMNLEAVEMSITTNKKIIDEDYDEDEDPYDYGNLISKFEDNIYDAIKVYYPDLNIDQFFTDIKYQYNNNLTNLTSASLQPHPYNILEILEYIYTLDYYIHLCLEHYMREYSYLHPGLAAFFAAPEPLVTPQYGPIAPEPLATPQYGPGPQYNKFTWDDLLSFMLFHKPEWVFKANVAMITGDNNDMLILLKSEGLPIEVPSQIQDGVEASLEGLDIEFPSQTQYNAQTSSRLPPVITKEDLARALRAVQLSMRMYQAPDIGLEARSASPVFAGYGGAISRYTMADYFYKYYRPYYELYYKKKRRTSRK